MAGLAKKRISTYRRLRALVQSFSFLWVTIQVGSNACSGKSFPSDSIKTYIGRATIGFFMWVAENYVGAMEQCDSK